ncbi:MAG: DUF4149 domain-containing protein [Bacteroidota bacterium]
MFKNIPALFSSIIIGIILFQSALIAPAINYLINPEEAALFLRFVWPKFFMIIAALSATSILSLLMQKVSSTRPKILSISSVVLMLVCYFLTPVINDARDAGNDDLWTILHMTTVGATVIVLVLNFLNLRSWRFGG